MAWSRILSQLHQPFSSNESSTPINGRLKTDINSHASKALADIEHSRKPELDLWKVIQEYWPHLLFSPFFMFKNYHWLPLTPKLNYQPSWAFKALAMGLMALWPSFQWHLPLAPRRRRLALWYFSIHSAFPYLLSLLQALLQHPLFSQPSNTQLDPHLNAKHDATQWVRRLNAQQQDTGNGIRFHRTGKVNIQKSDSDISLCSIYRNIKII